MYSAFNLHNYRYSSSEIREKKTEDFQMKVFLFLTFIKMVRSPRHFGDGSKPS